MELIVRDDLHVVEVYDTGAISFCKCVEYDDDKTIVHRLRGPAKIRANGDVLYMVDGQFHRENGPAINHSSYGAIRYYVRDQQLSETEYFLQYGVL